MSRVWALHNARCSLVQIFNKAAMLGTPESGPTPFDRFVPPLTGGVGLAVAASGRTSNWVNLLPSFSAQTAREITHLLK